MREDNSIADRLVREIDEMLEGIRSAPGHSVEERRQDFSREVGPRIEELRKRVVEHSDLRPEFASYASKAIELAQDFLHESLGARDSSKRTPEAARPTFTHGNAERLDALWSDGFCRFDVDGELAHRVWAGTSWERSLLQARSLTTPLRHCAMPLQGHSPGALLIKKTLEDGVLEIASRYIGKPMEFLYAALDFAHPGQGWYKDCYADVGIPTARTVYMHFDADSDVMKAMLYLKDVDADDGPFRFVRGSHLWKRSAFIGAVQRGFDQAQTRYFEAESDGLDYKLGYYRPRFKLVEHRKDTLTLPSSLRGSTHFGDDILDGSDLSEQLLRQEEVFTGPAGTLVLFDGSQGIHRGSLVTGGNRWAVQIGLRVRKGDVSATRLALKALKGRLSYQIVRARGLFTRLKGTDSNHSG